MLGFRRDSVINFRSGMIYITITWCISKNIPIYVLPAHSPYFQKYFYRKIYMMKYFAILTFKVGVAGAWS